MTNEQKTTVKGYVTVLDSEIAEGALLDLVVDIVSDRVLLYLNDTVIADDLLRVVAQVVVKAYGRLGTDTEREIASVSDNGQTVSYVHTRVNSDTDLLDGFTSLLAPYRRVHVIASTV